MHVRMRHVYDNVYRARRGVKVGKVGPAEGPAPAASGSPWRWPGRAGRGGCRRRGRPCSEPTRGLVLIVGDRVGDLDGPADRAESQRRGGRVAAGVETNPLLDGLDPGRETGPPTRLAPACPATGRPSPGPGEPRAASAAGAKRSASYSLDGTPAMALSCRELYNPGGGASGTNPRASRRRVSRSARPSGTRSGRPPVGASPSGSRERAAPGRFEAGPPCTSGRSTAPSSAPRRAGR